MIHKLRLLGATALAFVLGSVLQADEFDALDAGKDGWLSREEFVGPDIDFTALDVDGDKRLSRDEFSAKIDADKTTDTYKIMVRINGALRSFFFRNDAYPDTLQALVDDGQFNALPLDAWGSPLQYTKGRELTNEGPRPEQRIGVAESELKNFETQLKSVTDEAAPQAVRAREMVDKLKEEIATLKATIAIPLGYTLSSAGADQTHGNEDDMVRSFEKFRYRVPAFERRRAILEAEGEVNAVLQAWNHEQAFRLWLSVAEKEYNEGTRVTSLDEVKLSSFVFPENAPLDCFGRLFEIVTVRGLRAIVARGEQEGAGKVTLTEADFLALLQTRLSSVDNNDWNITNMARIVDQFLASKGRYPLTMPELRRAAGGNNWYFRYTSVSYATINDDSAFLFVDFGADGKPGGTGENADTLTYDDSAENLTDQNRQQFGRGSNQGFNQQAESIRYRALSQAVGAALKRQQEAQKDEAKDPSEIDESGEGEDEGSAEGSDKDGKADRRDVGMQDAQDAPDKPGTPAKPDAEPNAAPKPVIASDQDMIPRFVFDRAEMGAMGVDIDNDWTFNQHQNRLNMLSQALRNYTNDSKAKLPIGNVALSTGAGLRESMQPGVNDWNERWDNSEEDPIAAFVVARPVLGKNGRLQSAYLLAIPAPNSNLPIFVMRFSSTGGAYFPEQYYYARAADQAPGWLEAIVKVDGSPSAGTSTKDSKADDTDGSKEEPAKDSDGDGAEPEPVDPDGE